MLQTPTLRTKRVLLRPFTQNDTDAIYTLQSDAEVLRYWDSPPWQDRSRAERFIEACNQMEQDESGVRLAIESESEFIGWCCLTGWNRNFRSANLGYCFNKMVWGQGYATEAANALVNWAFESIDLNRIQAQTDTRNIASSRVLEKLGFMREGTLREDCIVNSEISDSWIFGLLKRQWRKLE